MRRQNKIRFVTSVNLFWFHGSFKFSEAAFLFKKSTIYNMATAAKNNEGSQFGFWWFRVNLLRWSMKMASAAARFNFILVKLE